MLFSDWSKRKPIIHFIFIAFWKRVLLFDTQKGEKPSMFLASDVIKFFATSSQALSSLMSRQNTPIIFSMDLKDAYVPIPVHPESWLLSLIQAGKRIHQFKTLRFGLYSTTAFTLLLTWCHQWGIHLHRYLDDWLVIADTLPCLLKHRCPSQFCEVLGIAMNMEKTDFKLT